MLKQQGKKMPNWVLIIVQLAVGVVITGGIFYVNQLTRCKSELADYMRSNPDTTAIVAYTIDEHGE